MAHRSKLQQAKYKAEGRYERNKKRRAAQHIRRIARKYVRKLGGKGADWRTAISAVSA